VQDSIEKKEGNASLGPVELDSLLCKAHDELTEDGSQSQYSVDEVACGEKSKSVITKKKKTSATNLTTDIPVVKDCHSDAEANSDNTCICTTPKTPKPRISIAIPPTPYYLKKKPSDSENIITIPIPTTKQKSRIPIDIPPIPASKKKNPTRKKKKCTACLLPNHQASPTQKTQHHALTKSSSRASRLVTGSKKKGESRIPGPLLKGYGYREREYRFRTVPG